MDPYRFPFCHSMLCAVQATNRLKLHSSMYNSWLYFLTRPPPCKVRRTSNAQYLHHHISDKAVNSIAAAVGDSLGAKPPSSPTPTW
jgi:hypothetical protein